MKPFFVFLLSALFFLFPLSANAHPHVWVTYWIKPVGSKDGIEKIRFTWKFDAMFTDMVKEEFSLKEITEKDNALLKEKAFGNLKNYHYYMYMTLDGAKFEPTEIDEFNAHMQGKNMVYDFSVKLPKAAKKIELTTYDDEFYVDLGPPTEQVPSNKIGGFMATTEFRAKDFLAPQAEAGSKLPSCTQISQERNNETWGKFTTFTVTCQAN